MSTTNANPSGNHLTRRQLELVICVSWLLWCVLGALALQHARTPTWEAAAKNWREVALPLSAALCMAYFLLLGERGLEMARKPDPGAVLCETPCPLVGKCATSGKKSCNHTAVLLL